MSAATGKRRPPIENMPAEHPLCFYCGRKLKVITDDTHEGGKLYLPIIRRVFVRFTGYGRDRVTQIPLFDRLVCAAHFGQMAYNAGLRVKGGPK